MPRNKKAKGKNKPAETLKARIAEYEDFCRRYPQDAKSRTRPGSLQNRP